MPEGRALINFTTKLFDTKPLQVYLEKLTTAGTFVAAPIAGSIVRMIIRDRSLKQILLVGLGSIIQADGTVALVQYNWASGGNDKPGVFLCEWEITYPSGMIETFPYNGYFGLIVLQDLN